MLQFSKFKVTIILGIILLGIIFSAPNLVPRDKLDSLPGWIPKTVVNLGLDLQGGSHLLLEVDTAGLVSERLNSMLDDVRSKLRGANIGYTDLVVRDGAVKVKLRDPGTAEQVRALLKDAVGDMSLDIAADGAIAIAFTEPGLKQLKAQTISQSIEIVRRRIDATGTKEPTIIRQGEDRIVVQLPGVTDVQHIK